MENNELYHHGTIGMRWGHKEKSSDVNKSSKNMSDEELISKVKRMGLEQTYNKMSSQKSSKLDKAKKMVDASSTAVNQIKTLNKDSVNKSKTREKLDLSNMTDQQLRDRINRTNLEKQYNDMFAKETVNISKGQKYTSNVLDVGGAALAIGSSALGIALAIKELRK